MFGKQRDNEILVLGSRNIVQNLYLADMYSDLDPYDWAIDFEKEVIIDLESRNFNPLVEYGNQKTKSISETQILLFPLPIAQSS